MDADSAILWKNVTVLCHPKPNDILKFVETTISIVHGEMSFIWWPVKLARTNMWGKQVELQFTDLRPLQILDNHPLTFNFIIFVFQNFISLPSQLWAVWGCFSCADVFLAVWMCYLGDTGPYTVPTLCSTPPTFQWIHKGHWRGITRDPPHVDIRVGTKKKGLL